MHRVRRATPGSYSESAGKAAVDADMEAKVEEALELHVAKKLSMREAARRAGLSSHMQVERTKKAMFAGGDE